METSFHGQLMGWETHGFRTIQDLDVPSIMKEAKSRWLRPNEIHAMLSNYSYFNILARPVILPEGGTIVFFDRSKLRYFRKDGHNWKKKKDGKTVKKAHERLKSQEWPIHPTLQKLGWARLNHCGFTLIRIKGDLTRPGKRFSWFGSKCVRAFEIGAEEKIHVYYAHGEDNPNFARRCYWLLEKALDHIVLVHYRETQEGSPVLPVNSDFSLDLSDPSASRLLSGKSNYQTNEVHDNALKESIETGASVNVSSHDKILHEINTLEWDELLLSNANEAVFPAKENTPNPQQYDRYAPYNLEKNGSNLLTNQTPADVLTPVTSMDLQGTCSSHIHQDYMFFPVMHGQIDVKEDNQSYDLGKAGPGGLNYGTVKDGLQSQDSFGRWIDDIMVESSRAIVEPYIESSVATSRGSFMSPGAANQGGSVPKQMFCITDVSPTWACSAEKTKILVVGFFHQEYQHLAKSNMFCVFGDVCVPAEIVQVGVFRCFISPHSPGLVNFYLSFDGCTAISQVLTLELRSPTSAELDAGEHRPQWDMFLIQMRLAHLLFSTSKSVDILSNKVSQNALKTGQKFASKYLNTVDSWGHFTKLVVKGNIPFERAKNSFFELTMKSKLMEWLLERIVYGSKISERDAQGQGVLHLCAILNYTWAVYPFSFSGLSLDFRDKFGWTALHWAAYFGRENMVTALLSAGAKPNLVTDSTNEKPGGCTAADLAYKHGFEGLAAYLSEKALVQQFEDMKVAGNATGPLEITSTYDNPSISNAKEEEIYMKETVTAYLKAANAADRIQAAFRERAFRQKTKADKAFNPEEEAPYIIAAMKMVAASRIQYSFRTWKLRKEFLNMRQQAIKIQAAFRSFQVRKQHRSLVWSVGVLEKAVLRWRMRRKGLRGLQIETKEPAFDQRQESDTDEDFYRASRKQAEERVKKDVVRVQAMFCSRQTQQEYRRMKLAHLQAKLGLEESTNEI